MTVSAAANAHSVFPVFILVDRVINLLTTFYRPYPFHHSRNIKEKEAKLKKMGGAEEVLFSFGKSYNHLPHCTGESQYCLIKKDDRQRCFLESSRSTRNDTELEIQKAYAKQRRSIQLTTLLKEEITAGRLNTRTAYLNIATMKKGDVFVSNK